MRVRFRLEAAKDVAAARDWYDEQRVGLGDDFVASLERTLELIIKFPSGFPEITAGHRRRLPDESWAQRLFHMLNRPSTAVRVERMDAGLVPIKAVSERMLGARI